MNTSIICAVLCCICAVSGFRLERREKRSSKELFINYVSAGGRSASAGGRSASRAGPAQAQTVTIENKEVQFEIKGGMTAVLDFTKMLMTMKATYNGKVCRTIRFDEELLPVTYQQIMDVLSAQGNARRQNEEIKIQMPTANVILDVQLAKDQTKPELSPLSAKLCEGLEVQVLEPKPEALTQEVALAHRRPMRPKREVGWGEIVLIVIVVIILL